MDTAVESENYVIIPDDLVYDADMLRDLLSNSEVINSFENNKEFLSTCIDVIPLADIYSYPGIAYEQLQVKQLRDARDDSAKFNTQLTLEGKTTKEDTRVSDSDYYQIHLNFDPSAHICELKRMKIDRRNIQTNVKKSAIALTLLNQAVADRLKKYTHESIRVSPILNGKQYEENITGLTVKFIQSFDDNPKCISASGTTIEFTAIVDILSGEVMINDYEQKNWPCLDINF